MTKYRIVEAKIPKIEPVYEVEIKYLYRYDVEYQESLLFGLIKRWNKCGSFDKLEQAKAKIKFLKEKETWKVINVD